MNGNMLLSPDALHCLKRKQLTNLCKRFGIKAVGKNADLIQRLQQYAASNIPSDSPTKGNVPILRHVKRPRQSDASDESSSDDAHADERPAPQYPPLTPRTRQKRVSDLVQAIEEVKEQADDMDTDDEDDHDPSQKNTILFPASSPTPARTLLPLSPPPPPAAEEHESTQPLRIIKALPSSNRIASPLSTATILEMSRSAAPDASSSLYPDLSSLPIPEGVSSECLVSSSTLPSITSRQFSAAAASVLAEMNARLTAAGRSATSGSLATMSSMGNGTWQNLAASASTQGMSKSRSGRYEIHHERQFKKMDSIVNHYAARRVGADVVEKRDAVSGPSGATSSTGSSSVTTASTATMTASTSTSQRRPRVDASTSTRSLAAMARSTSTRKLPVQRRPLPVPPVSQARLPASLNASASTAKPVGGRQPSSSAEPPRTKRLRLAVTEDQDALQNTVLEIPPEKKTVVIRVTRPEREGLPYKFSVASSSSDAKATDQSSATRAASSLRKTVIKATKSTFVGGGSAKKTAASAQAQRREAAFAKQQQQQAAMSRSISSRANLAASSANRGEGMPASASVRNKFTGAVTPASANSVAAGFGVAKADAASAMRKPSVAASASSAGSETSKQSSVSSRFGGSIRSSVSQGLGRAEAARQARLKEIKARTKAALAGFGSQRNVSASTTSSNMTTTAVATADSPRKAPTSGQTSFSPSVMRPTIASLGRSSANAASSGSASLPMLSAIGTAPLFSVHGFEGALATGLQRAATVHAGVGKVLTPCLTPRSSSLRHLRRVMRKQQKEADLEQVRVAAAENIAPGAVVPSVILAKAAKPHEPVHDTVQPSIRTVAKSSSPAKREASPDKYTTLPAKMRTRVVGAAARPAGPRAALVTTRATTSALNRL